MKDDISFTSRSFLTEFKISESARVIAIFFDDPQMQHCVKGVRIWNFSGPYFPVSSLSFLFIYLFIYLFVSPIQTYKCKNL